MRHHPDILIIGEIRDGETAQAVIRAALTGHTILRQFTPVTYWGATAFDKLGGPEHELAECLQGIIYQQILTTTINKEQVAGILYDYFFFKEAVIKSSWQKNLRKAWAYGFITEKRIFKPSNKLTKNNSAFLKLLADLLANGFNIQESFSFMKNQTHYLSTV